MKDIGLVIIELDIDPASPNFGKEVKGEFVSDRDIYSVFDDQENSNPKGPLGY